MTSFFGCADDALANGRSSHGYRQANTEFWCWRYNDNIDKAMVEQAF